MDRNNDVEMIIFYDDQCPTCVVFARGIKRADRNGSIVLHPASDAETLARYGINPDRAQRRVQAWHAPSGQQPEGMAALLKVAQRVPLLWPAVPILWLAHRLGLGNCLYDAFARRRHLFATLLVPAGRRK